MTKSPFPPNVPFVFASHSVSDQQNLLPLFENLLQEKIHLFVDRANELPARFDRFIAEGLLFNVEGGKDWRKYIDSAIFHCAILAPMMSSQNAQAYCTSDFCLNELEQAWALQKIILPISTDDGEKTKKAVFKTGSYAARLQRTQWRQARIGQDEYFARDMEILRGDIKKLFAEWSEARQSSDLTLLSDRQREVARQDFKGRRFRNDIKGNARFALIPPESEAGYAFYLSCKPISDKPMTQAEVAEWCDPPLWRLPNEAELTWALAAGHPSNGTRNPFGVEAEADPQRYWTQEKWDAGQGPACLLLVYRPM